MVRHYTPSSADRSKPEIRSGETTLTIVNMNWLLFAAMTFLSSFSFGAETAFRSGPARVRLIELYSSEGCSSCPPADAWLNALTKDRGLWRDFAPVAFHVDYWDSLGWKDPYADPRWTERQRAYAAAWGSRSVYTPGLVLDGKEWRDWGGDAPAPGEDAGILSVGANGRKIAARFSPAADAGAYDLYAARLEFDRSTEVSAGENDGKKLRHEFVVRHLARAKMRRTKDAWTATLDLPRASGRQGVVVWIVGPDGTPVQAAGGFAP